MSNVPVIQAVKAAEAFRKLHWRRVAGVLGVVALGATLSEAGALAGQAQLLSAGRLIYVVSAILAYAALMRLAFIDEHPNDPDFVPGPHGFQFGRPELRLLGVGALMLFIVILAMALAIFMVMLILVTAGIGAVTAETSPESIMEALGPSGQGTLSVVVMLFLGALLFLSVRLSLAGPATMSRRKVAVFETWGLTKGQFWRILAATILVGLPALAAGVVVGLGLNVLGGPVGPNGTPQVPLAAALGLGAVQGLVAAFIVLPLSVGLSAFLYRGLRDGPDDQRAVDPIVQRGD